MENRISDDPLSGIKQGMREVGSEGFAIKEHFWEIPVVIEMSFLS